MEIEHINEDTIRVRLRNADLEDMGVSFAELMSDQTQIESFFHHVLDEADLKEQFQDSDSVTFQVMPTPEGFDMFISKNMGFQEELASELEKIFPSNFSSEDEEDDEETESTAKDVSKELQTKVPVFELDSFEAVIHLAERFQGEPLLSELFAMNDKYYIAFGRKSEFSTHSIQTYASIAMEYGKLSSYTLEFLNEHAEILFEEDAFEQINFYF